MLHVAVSPNRHHVLYSGEKHSPRPIVKLVIATLRSTESCGSRCDLEQQEWNEEAETLEQQAARIRLIQK